jgi:hypothetical protein
MNAQEKKKWAVIAKLYKLKGLPIHPREIAQQYLGLKEPPRLHELSAMRLSRLYLAIQYNLKVAGNDLSKWKKFKI